MNNSKLYKQYHFCLIKLFWLSIKVTKIAIDFSIISHELIKININVQLLVSI